MREDLRQHYFDMGASYFDMSAIREFKESYRAMSNDISLCEMLNVRKVINAILRMLERMPVDVNKLVSYSECDVDPSNIPYDISNQRRASEPN